MVICWTKYCTSKYQHFTKGKKILGAHFRVEEIFSIPIQLTPIQVSFHS